MVSFSRRNPYPACSGAVQKENNIIANTEMTQKIELYLYFPDVWHEHNAQQIIPGDKNSAAVEGLKPATMYQFRLYAENQLGASEPSDILHVRENFQYNHFTE